MKNVFPVVLMLISIVSFAQEQEEERGHWDPTHNFCVQRLIILNDQGEMLLTRQEHVWASPSMIFEQRQHINEGIDSLSAAYGVEIEKTQLRGHFSYKYDYHNFATLRVYYVADYVSGDVQIPDGYDEAGWYPVKEALTMINVNSIQEITAQILDHPRTVWGGSYIVRRDGEDHPSHMVEPFYPLFESK